MGTLNLSWLLRRTFASTSSWLVFSVFSQKIYVNSKSSNPGAKRQCPWLFLQPCLSDAQVSWGQKSFNMQPDNSKLYSNSSSDAFWSGVPELHAPLQQSRPVIVPSDGHRRRQALRQNGRQDLVLQLFYIFLLQVGQNIASDGIMRQSLEMYDEYKQVSTTCKNTHCESLQLRIFLYYLYLHEPPAGGQPGQDRDLLLLHQGDGLCYQVPIPPFSHRFTLSSIQPSIHPSIHPSIRLSLNSLIHPKWGSLLISSSTTGSL